MRREKAINDFLNTLLGGELIISSNGKIGRELFELRKRRGEPTDDFYMQGSMGCAIGIGLGVALNTRRTVYVLTGDGAFLMKLGSLATVLQTNPPNLKIIVFNNNAHDSTGGQPTAFKHAQDWVGKHCLVIPVEKGARPTLTRPDISYAEITKRFRSSL